MVDTSELLSKLYEMNQNNEYMHKQYAFFTQLNEKDLECLASPQPLLVLFRTLNEKSDAPGDYLNYRKKDPADATFVKFFYLTPDHTVLDLHISVFRKLYACTDLNEICDEKNQTLNQNFFAGFFDKILRNPKLYFFEIKVDGQPLKPSDFKRKLSEFVKGGASPRLLATVHLKTPDSKLKVRPE